MAKRREKIREICNQLEAQNEEITVFDICLRVGYGDPWQFESVKKEVYAIVEAEFRNLMGKKIFLDEAQNSRTRKGWEALPRRKSKGGKPERNMKAVIKVDQRQLQLLDAGEAASFEQASARRLPSKTAVEVQARFGEAMLRRIDHEYRMRGQSEEMAAVQRSRADRAEAQVDSAQRQIEALLQQNSILLQQNARLQAVLANEDGGENQDTTPSEAVASGLPSVSGAQ